MYISHSFETMSRSETLRDNQSNGCSRRRGSPSRCTHIFQGNPDITDEKLLSAYCNSRYKAEFRSLPTTQHRCSFITCAKQLYNCFGSNFQSSLYVKGFTFYCRLELPKSSVDLFYRGCYPFRYVPFNV